MYTPDAAWLAAAEPLVSTLVAVAPIWILGLVAGYLLPRPKWASKSSFIAGSLLGSGLRRLALLFHALVILREVWNYCTHPGTFRGLAKATGRWAVGSGWSFAWPVSAPTATTETSIVAKADVDAAPAPISDTWYVTDKDLAFFQYHAVEGGPCEGASEWEQMMHKDLPGFLRYTAWRRTLPSGRTEYKSVTIAPDATAEEFMDMYLDDSYRRNWDGMVIHHEVLEHGDFSQRQQVVRWIRRFPFSFLSDREYTIARRMIRAPDGALYGLTKALDGHPREYTDSNLVKMSTFWSMWRSRTVECPYGSGRPACETTLLHHEDFKIPERLARFAVRHGMWGFVRGLGTSTPRYVAARRLRCAPHEVDAAAYGGGCAPNPPLPRSRGAWSSASSLSTLDSASSSADSEGSWGGEEAAAGAAPRSTYVSRRRRPARTLAVALLASSVALILRGAVGGGAPKGCERPIAGATRGARQPLPSSRCPSQSEDGCGLGRGSMMLMAH